MHAFTLNDIDGKAYPLAQHKDKVVLLVNVASRCGYTKQYAGLQKLHERYQGKPFVLIGIPMLIALGIFWLVMVILSAVRANDAKPVRYPLTIRFL